MKLHQLNAFLAAVEMGSIHGAARKLFLSQVAVTKALRDLEEDMGASLIRRSVRGITLTEAGTRLLARAKLIDQQIHLARDEQKQMQGVDEGSVAFGVTPLVAMTVLPHAVVAFRRQYKKVTLHVVEGLEGNALPGIRNGSLDFGVMFIPGSSMGEDLTVEPWFSAPTAVVVRDGHPKAQVSDLADLVDQEWLVTSLGGYRPGARLSGYFKEAGLSVPSLMLRCESVIAAGNIARVSDVVMIMPRGLLDCPENQGIRAVPLSLSPPEDDFGMVTRVDVPLTPVADAFARILRDKTLQRFGPPRRK